MLDCLSHQLGYLYLTGERAIVLICLPATYRAKLNYDIVGDPRSGIIETKYSLNSKYKYPADHLWWLMSDHVNGKNAKRQQRTLGFKRSNIKAN